MEHSRFKDSLLLITFAAALLLVVVQFDGAVTLLGRLLGELSPVLLACVIAFVLNVPMKQIEKRLFLKKQKLHKMKRTVSYVATLVIVLGILTLAMVVVIPELVRAVKSLAHQVPVAMAAVQAWLRENTGKLPQVAAIMEDFDLDVTSISSQAAGILQSAASGILSSSFSFIGSVVSGIISFLIGIVFSVYVLFQKEKLALQAKKILYALLPADKAEHAISIGQLSNRVFSNFLSGQCLEACILGTMFVIAMSILRLPYAMLIGVVIAISALIPIVGAFIGCVAGMILIVMVNPVQAVWFLILFLVLQQIEGNLIYPRVVGSSIGLPSMWVLVAVSIGGKLFGILGILLFIPLCSVCYALFRDYINKRLQGKEKGGMKA